MNATLPISRIRRRRPTPWPIRIFVAIAILFGIWVDVSTPGSIADTQPTVDPTKTPLLGLTDEPSFTANLVRTLASRR